MTESLAGSSYFVSTYEKTHLKLNAGAGWGEGEGTVPITSSIYGYTKILSHSLNSKKHQVLLLAEN